MQKFLCIFILLYCSRMASQSVTPSVYNADGGMGIIVSNNDTFRIFYNIGEPVTDDVQNGQVRLTQGFLQPDIVMHNDTIHVNTYTTGISCSDASDASITLNATGLFPPFTYKWYKNGVQFQDTVSSATGLGPGLYAYTVSDAHGKVTGDTVIVESSSAACEIIVHNAFTPNGDGINDVFDIEHIENFPDNMVSVFNRWGSVVWEERGYNNTWKGQGRHGETLAAGTYFFIIEYSGKKIKGWLELMR